MTERPDCVIAMAEKREAGPSGSQGGLKAQAKWGSGTQDLASSERKSRMNSIPNTVGVNSMKGFKEAWLYSALPSFYCVRTQQKVTSFRRKQICCHLDLGLPSFQSSKR